MALGKFAIELAEAHAKLELIKSIYAICYNNVASFYHDNVGVELSYIVQAVTNDAKCELSPFSILVQLLRAEFGPLHIVWKYVIVEPTVTCVYCETEVLCHDAGFCVALGGWLGHRCCSQDSEYEEISYE